MSRRFVHLFLMLCMCWQSLAFAGVGVLVVDAHEVEHEMLHFEGEAHHHDEHDGDFHQDDSPASVKHAMTDACVFAPVLPGSVAALVLSAPADLPSAALSSEPPLPFLSGPERPPKTLT